MTKQELDKKLELHKKWLNEEEGGERLRLQGTNLQEAYLQGADLREAYLQGADLREANLQGADLREADLRKADLRRADLREADLREANLREADLQGADLREADLQGADLQGTDLREANLRKVYLQEANLQRADLRETDLREAYLQEANLQGADLQGTKNVPNGVYPLACPSFGAFVGWKKASGYIVKLEIAEDAKRSSATGRKCRCDKARVLAIENIDGSSSGQNKVASNYNKDFVYEIGEVIQVDDFDTDRWNECAPGIHFFITREEAVQYFG